MNVRDRIASGLKAFVLLTISITITAAIAVAMLVDTVAPPAWAASVDGCMAVVHPVPRELELVAISC